MTRSEAARLGGLAIRKARGREYLREIASKGFMATVARHWAGDKKAYLEYLRCRAGFSKVERLVDRQLDAAIADGATIACAETSADDTEIPW
jgi:hypothetical protein